VIVSQPSNPWQAGNANLFTREFYQAAANNLARGGIFSQWIGLYDITPENLRIASATLLDVFPHTLAFKSGGDLLILASATPLNFDFRTLAGRIQRREVREVLSRAEIHGPGDLLAKNFLLSGDNFRRFAAGAELNTDDQPTLEFSFRYNLGGKMFSQMKSDNLANLQAASGGQVVPLVNLGATRPEIAAALRDLQGSYARAGRHREARKLADKLVTYEAPSAELATNDPFGG
jgi:spermidine synthase